MYGSGGMPSTTKSKFDAIDLLDVKCNKALNQ
jgi:hypothetical protein